MGHPCLHLCPFGAQVTCCHCGSRHGSPGSAATTPPVSDGLVLCLCWCHPSSPERGMLTAVSIFLHVCSAPDSTISLCPSSRFWMHCVTSPRTVSPSGSCRPWMAEQWGSRQACGPVAGEWAGGAGVSSERCFPGSSWALPSSGFCASTGKVVHGLVLHADEFQR